MLCFDDVAVLFVTHTRGDSGGNPRIYTASDSQPAISIMKDSRGVNRGKCRNCTACSEYSRPDEGLKCSVCEHPPGAHDNQDSGHVPRSKPAAKQAACTDSDSDEDGLQFMPYTLVDSSQVLAPLNQVTECFIRGCNQPVEFDMNTGEEYRYCSFHMKATAQASSVCNVSDGGIQMNDDGDSYAMAYMQPSLGSDQSAAYAGQLSYSKYPVLNKFFNAHRFCSYYLS